MSAVIVDIQARIEGREGDVLVVQTDDGQQLRVHQSLVAEQPDIGEEMVIRLMNRSYAQLDREELSRTILNELLRDGRTEA
jgi:hypothetical protein